VTPISKQLTQSERVAIARQRLNQYERKHLDYALNRVVEDIKRSERDDSGHVEAEEIAYDAANMQDRWDGGAL
jgi:hypothetical protein